MSRKYKQNEAGDWVQGSRVLASPMFYGEGWHVRDGFLVMRSSAKDPRRTYRKLRTRLAESGTIVAVSNDWKQGNAFFPPKFKRQASWSVSIVTFAPSADVGVAERC